MNKWGWILIILILIAIGIGAYFMLSGGDTSPISAGGSTPTPPIFPD
tara:strand:+ start:894 stop:1034 length:141 start_codon:yes stop_codon:yes gene_type:complete